MGNSQPAQQTQSTKVDLLPEQQQLMDLAMPNVKSWAATVPQRYQGDTVAGFDPAQTAGQNMVLGAAAPQQQLANSAANTTNFMQGDIWNPDSNPNLKGAIDAAVRPITQNYQEVVQPGTRDQFVGNAGQVFGGSRREIADAADARNYMQAVGDTSFKIAQDQYATNINAQLKALALTPQTQQAQLAPGMATSGVGDVRQALAQELINADVSGYNYDQMAPFLQSQDIMALLAGMPGAGSTTTASVPQKNQAMTALGGAATGASLGTALMPGVGTAAGALGGGLLGYFS